MQNQLTCPHCSGNFVQRVVALYNIQSGYTAVDDQENYFDQEGKLRTRFFQSTVFDQSNLGKILTPPAEPQLRNLPGCFYWLIILLPMPFAVTGVYSIFVDGLNFIVTPLTVLYLYYIWKEASKSLKDRNYNKASFPWGHSRWEKAMVKWNRLYYCHTEGIVFDPDSHRWIDANYMYKLLFD